MILIRDIKRNDLIKKIVTRKICLVSDYYVIAGTKEKLYGQKPRLEKHMDRELKE